MATRAVFSAGSCSGAPGARYRRASGGKKGLRYLLVALPANLARHPSASLTVVGFGPEEDERRAQAAALGIAHQVNFLGPLSSGTAPALSARRGFRRSLRARRVRRSGGIGTGAGRGARIRF